MTGLKPDPGLPAVLSSHYSHDGGVIVQPILKVSNFWKQPDVDAITLEPGAECVEIDI